MKDGTLWLRRIPGHALVGADDATKEFIAAIEPEELVTLYAKRDRSLPQHRLFWSVLQHVAEASDYETPEKLLVALKIRLERFDLMKMPSGKVVPVPQSISFSSMGQDDFQRFFDESVRVICEEVLGGYNPDDLIREVESKGSGLS